ncbi:Uncharacterized protein TCM_026016 [Theobroma cacao]|uniref:Secreted protein n=1 Tax=Theobroma cacao TaxID=3641 RepID=A0A061F069_THECC|nr:Uncharacterized protein TCM_026016 [Theobroma cacao]
MFCIIASQPRSHFLLRGIALFLSLLSLGLRQACKLNSFLHVEKGLLFLYAPFYLCSVKEPLSSFSTEKAELWC